MDSPWSRAGSAEPDPGHGPQPDTGHPASDGDPRRWAHGQPTGGGYGYLVPPAYPVPSAYPAHASGSPYGYRLPVAHAEGTTVLVLGILGLTVCPFLAVPALVMGTRVLREIDQDPAAWNNRGSVSAGRICGLVMTCLMGAVVAFYLVLFLVLLGTDGFTR